MSAAQVISSPAAPADPAAPAAPAQPAAPAAPAQPAEWWAGYAEPDYVKAKGWKTPLDAVTSYRNLEQIQRNPGDYVRLPKDEKDTEARDALFAKLGRPEKPDGYEFEGYEPPAPESGMVDMAPWFREKAHAIGLSKGQAGTLFKEFQAETARLDQTAVEARNRQLEVEEQQLKSEWGPAWDENAKAINAFAQRFQVGKDEVNAIESVLGYGWVMRFMARAGRALGEHKAAGADTQQPYGMTPEIAKQKIQSLTTDKAFYEKLRAGDPIAKREWEELHKVAHGATPVDQPTRA